MKILVLDNYDSFTYNLVQYLQEIVGYKIDVFRNDAISLEAVDAYDTIILSPGPSLPKDAGILLEVIKTYAPTKAILGVCLGHQAIGEAYGGDLINLAQVYHGVSTDINILNKNSLFQNLPETIHVGRYHSWCINADTLPDCFEVTAEDDKGEIMAITHKDYFVKGVQFHPESVMTPDGMAILRNFLGAAEENLKSRKEALEVSL